MLPMHDLISVETLPEMWVRLGFSDGFTGLVGLADLASGSAFAALADPELFTTAEVDMERNVLRWVNGTEIDGAYLYHRALRCPVRKSLPERLLFLLRTRV